MIRDLLSLIALISFIAVLWLWADILGVGL